MAGHSGDPRLNTEDTSVASSLWIGPIHLCTLNNALQDSRCPKYMTYESNF